MRLSSRESSWHLCDLSPPETCSQQWCSNGIIKLHYTVFQKKRSQYAFRHIFSKRGTILNIFGSIRFLGNLLMKQRSNSSQLLLYVSTLPCKTE